MLINHLSEFFVGFQALPLQARAPVLEESPRPALALVIPELTERFLEKICRVQALVGRQQGLQRTLAVQVEILPARQQRVLLALDVLALVPAEARVFRFAHRVERFAQMSHDVELVKQDCRLRRLRVGRVAEWLPHIHHGQPNPSAFLLAEPLVEYRHARLRAILAAKPDRSFPNQIAHHDAIGVTFADRDLVNADRLGSGSTDAAQLLTHVLLVQFLDGAPVQMQLVRHIRDRRCPTAPSDEESKAFCIKRAVRQPRKLLLLHRATAGAPYPPQFELQVDAGIAAGEITNAVKLAVVDAIHQRVADPAVGFFFRRSKRRTRAFESPNTPRVVAYGRKPEKRNKSVSRREVAMRKSCQIFSYSRTPQILIPCGSRTIYP